MDRSARDVNTDIVKLEKKKVIEHYRWQKFSWIHNPGRNNHKELLNTNLPSMAQQIRELEAGKYHSFLTLTFFSRLHTVGDGKQTIGLT